MELDGLFVNSKWKIVELITNEPQTPQELSLELNTSLANISQQLRFLDFAGLTKKTRVPRESFGKPNNKISISNDFAYVVSASKGCTKKKLFFTNDFQQLLISCWLNFDTNKEHFENFILDNKKQLSNIQKIVLDRSSNELFVETNTPKKIIKKYGDLNFIFDSSIKKNSNLEVIFKR